jgi:hypothetical protein
LFVSSTGNDANTGIGPVNAWRSIARVNQEVLAPGDRVSFEGGSIFTGTVELGPGESGTPQSPITFTSYGVGQATIWGNTNSGFDLVNVAGIRITNLFVAGSGSSTNNGIGISFYTDLPGDVKLHFVRILGCRVAGFRRGGISIGAWNGRSGFEDVDVENCRLDHNGNNGMAVWGFYSDTWGQTIDDYPHRDLHIGGNVFESNWGDPQLTTRHTGSGIEVAQAALVTIEHNEAFDNGRLNTYAGGGPVGIWMWDVLQGSIQYNESHHNMSGTLDGGGFDLDGGCVQSFLQYNYSHDNEGSGFMVAQFAFGARPMRNAVVRYNVSERDAGRANAGALQLWSGDVSSPIDSAFFHNNTVYVEEKPLGIPRAFRAFGAGDVVACGFANNLFYVHGPNAWIGQNALNTPAAMWIGNLYWADGGPFTIRDGSTYYGSLVDWRNATGEERVLSLQTGYELDPQLVAPGAGGTIGITHALTSLSAYQLLPASPIRDLGLHLTSPGPTDFWGIPIYQGASLSIGAHEGL